MPRVNIELPEYLINRLNEYAKTNNLTIAESINQLILEYQPSEKLTKKRQNLFLTDETYSKVKEIAVDNTLKRGNKIYPGSKTTVIQDVLFTMLG